MWRAVSVCNYWRILRSGWGKLNLGLTKTVDSHRHPKAPKGSTVPMDSESKSGLSGGVCWRI